MKRVSSPESKTAVTHGHDLPFTGVDDADLLVLAGGTQQAAIAAPADTKDDIRVHVLQADHGLARAHIPDEDLVVTAYNRHMILLCVQLFQALRIRKKQQKAFGPIWSSAVSSALLLRS